MSMATMPFAQQSASISPSQLVDPYDTIIIRTDAPLTRQRTVNAITVNNEPQPAKAIETRANNRTISPVIGIHDQHIIMIRDLKLCACWACISISAAGAFGWITIVSAISFAAGSVIANALAIRQVRSIELVTHKLLVRNDGVDLVSRSR